MHLTVHRLQRQKRFVTKYSAAKEARVESRAEQTEEERESERDEAGEKYIWNKPLPSNGEQKGHNGAQFGIKLIFDRQRDRELKIEIREHEIEGASKQ